MKFEFVSTDTFNNSVINFQKNKSVTNGSELATIFNIVAGSIWKAFRVNHLNEETTRKACVLTCFEKIDDYNPSKGPAFNYFTTVMLNKIRSLYKPYRQLDELSKKYKEYVQ